MTGVSVWRRKESMKLQTVTDEPVRIVLVTDAWLPQVNGVVTTLTQLKRNLELLGQEVITISPDLFLTAPMPTYPEIRLALFPYRKVASLIREAKPHAIHIATEGPLGSAARRYCRRHGLAFSTSFHTRFPEYLRARTGAPESWGYSYLRSFHSAASALMVATPALQQELKDRGFGDPVLWPRGVDVDMFRPQSSLQGEHYLGLERPVWLFVGRLAVEKNLEAFLDLDLPGTKMMVGDGPLREQLQERYPDAHFTGTLLGEKLAEAYAAADCFVFPSVTDTFGLVLLEALAAGTPVAAYPVRGPVDVVGSAPVGALDEDLRVAAMKALTCSREAARDYALTFSWENCARQFLKNLALRPGTPPPAAQAPDPSSGLRVPAS